MTPLFLGAYAIWIPLSMARPVILPKLWSECAPIGQIRYGQKESPSGSRPYMEEKRSWQSMEIVCVCGEGNRKVPI